MRIAKTCVSFCAMLEELQEIYKRSTSCIDYVQIFTQFPFTTIERTMKEFGVSNVVNKSRALKKEKGNLGEYSRIFSPYLPHTLPFLFFPGYIRLFSSFQQDSTSSSAQVTLLCPVCGALFQNDLFFILCSSLLTKSVVPNLFHLATPFENMT